MSVEITGVTLVSPNPTECCEPYVWNVALTVPTPEPPKGVIEICVTFGDPDCNPDRDVVLDEVEIDGSSLRKGKNLIQIEHDALPFDQLKELMDDERIQCPLLMTFRYVKNPSSSSEGEGEEGAASGSSSSSSASPPIFHTCGVQVNIKIREGVNIEEVETFNDPKILVREALVDKSRFGRGMVHTPREIEWDVVAAEEEEEQGAEKKEKNAAVTEEGTCTNTNKHSISATGSDDEDDEEEMFGGSDEDNEGEGEGNDGESAAKKLRSE